MRRIPQRHRDTEKSRDERKEEKKKRIREEYHRATETQRKIERNVE
jgi:hypothetical protein